MFRNFLNALGLGSSKEYEEEFMNEENSLESSATSPFTAIASPTPTSSEINMDETVSEIFDEVIGIFNKSLPDFLRNSVDEEKEKNALYEALSSGLKSHIKSIENHVATQLDNAWRAEREKMQNDLNAISRTAKEVEAKRDELKQQQLSAERQKRAMTERIHELERQAGLREAEKEQLELENKSMINKIKVAQVYEKELEELRARLNADPAETSAMSKELFNKIENLERENKELSEKNVSLSEIEVKYNKLLEKMHEFESQFVKVEEIVTAKDDRIAQLERQLNELASASNEKEEMTTAGDLASEPEYRNQLDANLLNDDNDDIVNDTEWIVRAPQPQNKTNYKKQEKTRNKKNKPKDDGQMSLW